MNQYEYCVAWIAEQASAETSVTLDYGCGAGEIVAGLRQRGVEAFGCDVFYEGGDYSTKVKPTIIDYVRKMENGIAPFADSTFDFVVNNQVLEHVENLDAVLIDMARVLKPGGQLLSLFPYSGVWREGHCGIAFLHWFPRGSRVRTCYAATMRALGLGYHKKNLTILAWSRHKCQWLDKWTYYRDYASIHDAFARHFDDVHHIEEHWLQGRLGPRAWMACWLPAQVQRFLVRKLCNLVIVCSKAESAASTQVG